MPQALTDVRAWNRPKGGKERHKVKRKEQEFTGGGVGAKTLYIYNSLSIIFVNHIALINFQQCIRIEQNKQKKKPEKLSWSKREALCGVEKC